MKRVIVIGGGAAGLSAATAAAERGADVTLLERLPRVGKKILLTGNGRCNLGNLDCSPAHYHGSCKRFSAYLRDFDIAAYYRGIGVLIRADSEGRLYPRSGTAASVLDAMRFAADRAGVRTLTDMQVTGLRRERGGLTVFCGDTRFSGDMVIAAAGGSAAPACGTDGNLLPLMERLGHVIVPPKPALCPIPTDAKRVKPMKGMRVRAAVSVMEGKTVLRTETGELQFTENALSGICVFDLSYLTAQRQNTEISVDLLPEYPAEELAAIIAELTAQRGQLPAGDLLTGMLPKRVSETLMREVYGSCSAAAGELVREPAQLARVMKDWRFPVRGQAGFAQAQVTAGGIAAESVTDGLASRCVPGLYFAGEILDIHGDCGGRNLAFAVGGTQGVLPL